MNKSDYLANQQLNASLRGVAFTPPTTVYAGLFTTTPTSAGGGVEVAVGSYGRKPVTFGAPSGRACSNTGAVVFDEPLQDWGRLEGVALFDALTGGNMLYFGDLAVARMVQSGDAPAYFPAGYFTVRES